MSDQEALQKIKSLVQWAKSKWGVETERKYLCPNDNYNSDYEGYCPNDGRKLRETIVDSQTQQWQRNLEDIIYNPEEWAIAPSKEDL